MRKLELTLWFVNHFIQIPQRFQIRELKVKIKREKISFFMKRMII